MPVTHGLAPVAVAGGRVALVRAGRALGVGADGAVAALDAGLAVVAGVVVAQGADGGVACGAGGRRHPAVARRHQARVGAGGARHIGQGDHVVAAGRAVGGPGGGGDCDLAGTVVILGALLGGGIPKGGCASQRVAWLDDWARIEAWVSEKVGGEWWGESLGGPSGAAAPTERWGDGACTYV